VEEGVVIPLEGVNQVLRGIVVALPWGDIRQGTWGRSVRCVVVLSEKTCEVASWVGDIEL
jgi:hypothetical protein